MSLDSLFSKPNIPAPQPVPVTPMQDPAAEQRRLAAEQAALADSRSRGRASTIAGGGAMLEEEQQRRGLANRQRRTASREMLG